MIPKQGESENTGGKRIKKVHWSKGGRKKKKKRGEGRKKYSFFLLLLLYSLLKFFSFCFILFVHFLFLFLFFFFFKESHTWYSTFHPFRFTKDNEEILLPFVFLLIYYFNPYGFPVGTTREKVSTGSVGWLVTRSTAFKIIPHHSWHMQPSPAMVAFDRTQWIILFLCQKWS